MFKNYYAILEISRDANSEEIKSAFRRQALKWHPDRNPDGDATLMMQLINEAKLILLDTEARTRYDIEYDRYTTVNPKQGYEQNQKENSKRQERQHDFEDNDYQVRDEELYRWMNNAKKQSVSLAKKTIEDFSGMVKVGTKAAVNSFVTQIVFGVAITIIILLVQTCSR